MLSRSPWRIPCALAIVALGFGPSIHAQEPAASSPSWSTYVGGKGGDRFYAVAAGSGGRVILAGQSLSTDFPATAGAVQTTLSGASDAVVACFDPAKGGKDQLVWATYFGGTGDEAALDLHVDPVTSVVTIVGWTSSKDLPTKDAFQSAFGGGAMDIFTARISADGQQLVHGTYLGGSDDDWGTSVAVDAQGRITLCGTSYATNFPTRGAYQAANAGDCDLVLARLDPRLVGAAQLLWSSYLGGKGTEGQWITFPNPTLGLFGVDIAVDAQGIVTVASRTSSRDFPVTAGTYQTTHAGGSAGSDFDVCISRIDPAKAGAAQMLWSTYLGGGGTEGAMRVAVDGGVTIMGYSSSGKDAATLPALPVSPGAWQKTYAGGDYDCFAARLALDGKSLSWLTYVGGSADRDYPFGMHVGPDGSVTMGGYSYSKTLTGQLPTTAGSYQATQNVVGPFDGFLCRLSPDGHRLDYSSYVGGDNVDVLVDFAPDPRGGLLIAGLTQSTDYPVSPGTFQPATSGIPDGIAMRWDPLPLGVRRLGTGTPACSGPILSGVTQMPSKSLTGFRLTCASAPPASAGVLLIGNPRPAALTVLGVRVFTDPALSFPLPSGPQGYVETPLPLHEGTVGLRLGLQYVWLNTAGCGGAMTLSASDALDVTVL